MRSAFFLQSIRYFSLLFAVLYLLVAVPLPHLHIHQHEHISHTAEIHAQDACHNFVFHGIPSEKCTHPGHAYQAESDCLDCHGFFPTKVILGEKLEVNSIISYDFKDPSIHLKKTGAPMELAYFLRGPPQKMNILFRLQPNS